MSKRGIKYNLQPAVTTGDEQVFGIHHHATTIGTLPASFDLRSATKYVPPILDQGNLGSCCAQELSNALRFCIGKELGALKEWQPSRLFLYYFGRLYEGSDVSQDTGMSISGACGAVAKYGACIETKWTYDVNKFTIQPPRSAILDAHTHVSGYRFLQVPQDLHHIKSAIFSGFPVLIGLQIYDSFEADSTISTGIVPMPDTSTENLLGGHCLIIYYFNDSNQTFGIMNSWGVSVGKDGWFTVPYAYVLDPNLAGDICQVRWFK